MNGTSAKGLLVKLANQICREHGQATNQKISVAVFLATGKWVARPKAWVWLCQEYQRRNGQKISVGRKKKGGGVQRPIKIRTQKPRTECLAQNFTSTPEWRRARFEALRHSNGCCSLCGRSNREHGVILHVDHIKPKSKHPELALTLSNLQILCEDCNMGKGNRDDTDWRKPTEIDRDLDARDWRNF